MRTFNILVVDDTAANIEAAKAAALKFPQLQCTFFAKYTEVEEVLLGGGVVDGVITDLVFDNDGATMRDLSKSRTVQMLRETSVDRRVAESKVVAAYYKNLGSYAVDGAFNNAELFIAQEGRSLGGIFLMEAAAKRNLPSVLITDLHRHDARSADGLVLLIHLIARGILTVDEVMADGVGSKKYIGSEDMLRKSLPGEPKPWQEGYRGPKEYPETWEKAYQKLLSQLE